MLSISVLFVLIMISLIVMRFNRSKSIKYFILLIISLFLIEVFVYSYFLIIVYNANCFFLIGNQKVLDDLMKTRLSYAIYFAQGKKNFINQVDQTIGYTLGKDKQAGLYQTNKQGLRANKEYSLFPSSDHLRIAAFGDSFVFCDGVEIENAWPSILENSANNFEVLNFGVSGYGLGQSYLRYLREGLSFNPDIIFLNYAVIGMRDLVNPKEFAGNNNLRMAHFYRVNFTLEEGKLISKSVSLYDLFDEQFRETSLYAPLGFSLKSTIWSWPIFAKTNLGLFFKRLNLQKIIAKKSLTPEFKRGKKDINTKILENFFLTAKKNGSTVLLFFEKRFEKLPVDVQNLIKEYKNVVYVDSNKALKKQRLAENIINRGDTLNTSQHYNARGNQIYANAVLNILKSRSWGQGERTFYFDEPSNSFVHENNEKRIY